MKNLMWRNCTANHQKELFISNPVFIIVELEYISHLFYWPNLFYGWWQPNFVEYQEHWNLGHCADSCKSNPLGNWGKHLWPMIALQVKN